MNRFEKHGYRIEFDVAFARARHNIFKLHENSAEPASVILEEIKCYHPDRAYGCEDYPEEGFSNLISVEEGNFWFESRNRFLSALIRRHLSPLTNTKSFLEIGCGTGFVLRMLSQIPGLEVSGSEIHLSGAKMAARRAPQAEVFQMDALRMEFHRKYDAIGLFDVLEHIEDDLEIISRIRRALKQNGILFLTVPQYPKFWSPQDTLAGHKRRYAKADLENKIRQGGFQILYAGSLFCAIFPLYAISRLQKKRLSATEAKKRLMSEFYISPWLNYLLATACWLDLIAVQLGFRLPFGSSLVVVARSNYSCSAP
jgi:SAM-dependent methyltransferase